MIKRILALTLILLACFLPSCTSLFRPVEKIPPVLPTADGTVTPPSTEAPTETVDPTLTTDPTATSEPTPPTTEAPPETKTISFLGVGDNIIYYGNVLDAANSALPGGRKYNFKPAYDNVKHIIADADVSFINQEVLMTGGPLSYYPQFNSPQDLGHDLVELGFDVVNIATNHMLDCYENGLIATIDFWNTFEGITLVGGYKDQTDYDSIRYYEKDGIVIAFLAYTEHTNYLSLPNGAKTVVPYFDEGTIRRQIAYANLTADLVIVSAHWGTENTYVPTDFQTYYAQVMADAGADVILGHHPHVLQPLTWLTGKDGNKTLCAYSLGNFVSEMANDYNMLGGMLTFDITKTDSDTAIENVVFLPTVMYFDTGFNKNSVWLLENFTQDMADTHGILTYDYSYGYSESHHIYIDELYWIVKSNIPTEFLPEHIVNRK